MKKVCTIVFLSISLFCDAQTKQQTAQMEKELKELEKDDPDMAKQVRTMMKQKGASPSAATSVAPKFVSPITPILLKQPVSPPSESQANDRLLWFKGKKINDSILVTAKNTVVMYQKKKNQVVVQPPAAKDPFKKIVSELSNNEKKKTDLINSVASKKNSFFFYPFISEGLKEYDKAAKQYGELLK